MRRYTEVSALALIAALYASFGAYAQTTSADSSSIGAGANTTLKEIPEIVVTASKLKESVNKLPMSVTALTNAVLAKANVVDIKDLSSQAPSFNIGVNGVTSGVDLEIRGITTQNDDVAGNSAVAVMIDGVYVPRTQGLNQSLYDLDRVEILRGPQGTLYGRNATAGVVNIITAAPKLDGDHFDGDISYGNYNAVVGHATVNMPLSSTFAIRASVDIDRNDGYQKTTLASGAFNSPTGPIGPANGNYDREGAHGGRISALWQPTSKLSAQITIDGTTDHGSPALPTHLGTQTYIFANVVGTNITFTPVNTANQTDPFNRIVNLGGVNTLDLWNVRGHLDYNFTDAFSVTYTGGYGHEHLYRLLDGDGSNVNNGRLEGVDTEWTTYHEVNLKYNAEKLKWIAGANYSYENIDGNFDINSYGPQKYPNGAPQFPSTLQLYHPDDLYRSYGVFTQATYSVLPQLRLTSGVRYSNDFQELGPGEGIIFCQLGAPINNFTTCNPVAPAGVFNFGSGPGQYSIPNTEQSRFSNISWKAGLDYDLNDTTLTYVSATTGYKAGGPASNPFTKPYRPEKVISYEGGVKAALTPSFHLNTSVFYMDYKDYQVSSDAAQAYTPSSIPGFPNAALQEITVNAATATIYGMELEAAWRLGANDRIDMSGSWLHARFDKFVGAEDLVAQPGDPGKLILPPVLDLSGNRLIRSPDFSGRVNYEHTFRFNNGSDLTADISGYYQTMVYLREVNAAIDRQNGYGLLDGNLSYNFPNNRTKIELWGKNLTNTIYRVAEFAAVFNLNSFYGNPRTYGIRVKYSF